MIRALTSTAAVLTTFATTPVFAHSGLIESSSFYAGLAHPLTGIDHLLAMFAVGIWLTSQSNIEGKSIAGVFFTLLITGFVLGTSGVAIPMVESGIALSLLVFGLLIVSARKLSTAISLPLTAGFALFHGFAHGAEVGQSSITWFAAGFLLVSAILILTGSKFTQIIKEHMPAMTKLIGVMIAMAGLSFIAA